MRNSPISVSWTTSEQVTTTIAGLSSVLRVDGGWRVTVTAQVDTVGDLVRLAERVQTITGGGVSDVVVSMASSGGLRLAAEATVQEQML